ncbi:MAG: hypothetical protein NTX05_00610 [Fusobacteria bacterium]|nr:hypothetical protein [Fusobacteriota bacterium]
MVVYMLIIVIIIVAMIGVYAKVWSTTVTKERETLLKFQLAEMRSGIKQYYIDKQEYPTKISQLYMDRYCREDYVDPITNKKDFIIDVSKKKMIYANNPEKSLEGTKYNTW